MSKGRMQAGSCTAGMRREEVEALIRAANLGEEDSYIARRCLIDQVAQLDIAFEMEDKFGQGDDAEHGVPPDAGDRAAAAHIAGTDATETGTAQRLRRYDISIKDRRRRQWHIPIRPGTIR